MTAQEPRSREMLERETIKLKKINAALISRVERSMDQQANAFSLFETAIALDNRVLERTRQLQEALRSIERSNDDLLRAKQQAEAASSLKSSVLISVTHDLLQPLNAARLTLSTLSEMDIPGQGAALIGQVDRSLLTLEDLLRTLLDISKLDAGVLKPDIRPITVASLFEPLRQEFAPVAAKRGVALRILPSPYAVVSDPLMMRRILQNLLSNALRYTQKGGVLMGCRPRGDRLCIQVHDTGPGIPEAQQQAIFVEFQRGESSDGDQAGFGLGLSIVHRFATELGHDIQLNSRLGRGSTFSITLPRAKSEDVVEAGREVQHLDFRYNVLEGRKVLLIENDPSSAEAMAALLEKWGCDVATTTSATDAMDNIGALGEPPDAIIADLHLDHGENGLDAVNSIREQIKIDVPAIIVTADYSTEAEREAAVYGLELLRKPIKPAEMRSLLSFLLA
ncbi:MULTISPECIES: hybrid sensor histidine kinase/response regulator [unclassified Afipia]|uniref:ATP-binding response regulator n=3 Tax=Afipia TaxID=1033 RepID=UPI0004664EE2|nr:MULTISPECIES: hybrid sensor histidine kinase/response regulator [unclassified Afipia]MBQ8106572.1 hybrid sensor histidine kinase/response regulator [Afipia sp.]WIG53989.1 MAG: Two-component system sensor histidine kinase/response regulator hybrid [Afipia sp.]